MSQLDELESIFGRKPAPKDAPEREEVLEVYVTTTHRDTYKVVTIPVRSARPVLPLVMAQILRAVHDYLV